MRVLTKKETAQRCGLSVSTVRRLEIDGDFPRRVPLSASRVGWIESEIDRWIEERAAARDRVPA